MTSEPRTEDLLQRAGLAVLVSVLAGVLVAGLAFPLIGGIGIAAKASAESYNSLPTELEASPLAQRSRILAADGSTIANLFLQNRVLVPLSKVPHVARKAVIAIEDARFYEHRGVDYKGLLRAAIENAEAGEVTQGGSTITQQYVKNVLLESARTDEDRKRAVEQSTGRKLREARYAMALEKRIPKDEILQRYLNIAYFGGGAYGIGTAAYRYFGVPVEQLNLPQAAMLAGIVKNPTRYDPLRNPEQAVERRNLVLRRMAELRLIPGEQAAQAAQQPLALSPKAAPNGCEGSPAPFFCDWIRSSLENDPSFGATREERQARLLRGGLTIRTTLDRNVQTAAAAAVKDTIPTDNRVATAIVIVQPGSGKVLAIAANREFGKDKKRNQTEVPLATKTPGYQPGSTFKIFTLAAALEKGLPLKTAFRAGEEYQSDVFNNPADGTFNNAEPGEGGYYDIRRATELSINTFYVKLLEQVGVMNVARMAQRLGITTLDLDPNSRNRVTELDGSFTLGTREVTPLDMANAFATIAASGVRCDPVGVVAITNSRGESQPVPPKRCEQVLDPGIANTVSDVMKGVITSGTGRAADIGRPAAGKTGTTQNFGAAWFVGYTPDLAAAVWVGDPRGISEEYSLRGVMGYDKVYGGTLPAIAWQRAMSRAHEGIPVRDFPPPSSDVVSGQETVVPDVRGMTVEEATAVLTAAGLSPVVSGTRLTYNSIPEGRVASTSPRRGRTVQRGTEVRILLSNGGNTAEEPPEEISPGGGEPVAPQPSRPGKGKKR